MSSQIRCHYYPSLHSNIHIYKSINYIHYENEHTIITKFNYLNELTEHETYKINNEELPAKLLSIKYDSYKSYCFVLKIDPISFMALNNITTSYTMQLFEKIYINVNKYLITTINKWISTLGVVETAPRGTHLHFLILCPGEIDKYSITKIKNYLNQLDLYTWCHCLIEDPSNIKENITPNKVYCSINENLNWTQASILPDNMHVHSLNIKLMYTYQAIKSTSSYINYLQKHPYKVYHSKFEIGQYYVNFNKNHVFPETTAAKSENYQSHDKTHSNNPIVLQFFRLFRQGIHDYNDILKEKSMQAYLHIPNLKQIFTNCIDQFTASHTHMKDLMFLIERFLLLPINQSCCCPVYEWLQWQNIDIKLFQQDIVKWLNGVHKKNALVFKGPPNAGKSHVARLIWKQFFFHKRIIQDGIFTFANLLNCGLALWDEPFIAPDLADTTKLILEGASDVQISRKNMSSCRLGKRVPIIITTNKEISQYCSSDKSALDERCYNWVCPYSVRDDIFCTNKKHYCMYLDSAYRTFNPFTDQSRDEIRLGEGQITSSEETCTELHKINEFHVVTFLIRCLFECKYLLEPFPNESIENHQLFNDLINKCEHKICFMSKNHCNKNLIE